MNEKENKEKELNVLIDTLTKTCEDI